MGCDRFFVANLVLFYLLFRAFPVWEVWLGRAFFIWISVFNLFVVSVFWSFMTDSYSEGQGKRLFGFIGLGDMGSGLAKNLIAHNFHTSGFDLSDERMDAFDKLGGHRAANAPRQHRGSQHGTQLADKRHVDDASQLCLHPQRFELPIALHG